MCLSPTLYILTIIVSVLMFFIVLLIGLSMMTLKHFPTTKLSGWVRRHIITDEDLEPKG
jgi:hypothetical protein